MIRIRVYRGAAGLGPGRRRGERGLTLVEMLIALALLGFILLGILPLFMGSVKSNFSANEYTSIHNLSRDRLEQLMNLPFNDAQLSAGIHANDLPAVLPDPSTGVPPVSGGVVNPFTLSYQVRQYQIPASGAVATNAPFTSVRVGSCGIPCPLPPGSDFQYKRIDVTVLSGYQLDPADRTKLKMTNFLGFGVHAARLSGVISNPNPGTIKATVDPDP